MTCDYAITASFLIPFFLTAFFFTSKCCSSFLMETVTVPPSITPCSTIREAIGVNILSWILRRRGRAPYCGLYPLSASHVRTAGSDERDSFMHQSFHHVQSARPRYARALLARMSKMIMSSSGLSTRPEMLLRASITFIFASS